MARLGKFPFVPNMEDCKMVVQTDGAICYIMDTYCRNVTQADKERADQEIMRLALASAMRKKAQGTA